jgi:cell fate (sporulation/competence/biofilm development) regulator YlbF (YheA/YmcA/DUF963 family)
VTYTDADKLKEIEREIAMRRKIYPSWIAQNRLSYAAAERQLKILEAIAEDYRLVVNQTDLFGV